MRMRHVAPIRARWSTALPICKAVFGPWLHKVSIQADETPELEIVLRTTGLNVEEIRALITAVRAMGRAALLR